ncbi:MAG: tetratricopeptide repeat protein [Pyrinomonadaceae bacterium]
MKVAMNIEGRVSTAPFSILLLAIASLVSACFAEGRVAAQGFHQVEGRIRFKNEQVGNMRVRLVHQAEMRPITETFSRSEGQFRFDEVPEGDYLVETFETDKYEASTTTVSVRPFVRGSRVNALVTVELTLKASSRIDAPPGVVAADVDLNVPKAAVKHYKAGIKALRAGESARAVSEFQEAIKNHPDYYAARLELGRELGAQKRYQEAEEALKPLGQTAPKRSEARVEYGKILLALKRQKEAVSELLAALRLDENSWEINFYLGWALLEMDGGSAEQYFLRAVELNEPKAARAHVALARLAEAKGMREEAIKHLELYLASAPNAPDAEAARRLAESLRRK